MGKCRNKDGTIGGLAKVMKDWKRERRSGEEVDKQIDCGRERDGDKLFLRNMHTSFVIPNQETCCGVAI